MPNISNENSDDAFSHVALSTMMVSFALPMRRADRFTESPIHAISQRRSSPTGPKNTLPVEMPMLEAMPQSSNFPFTLSAQWHAEIVLDSRPENTMMATVPLSSVRNCRRVPARAKRAHK